ncbi:sugar ABC transporter substrate-binding protein [Kocuria coralli]|uniref:Sugar ABC transporter substrate-binding protein n=1 Tax=Kocuria coralli TaxID=1461025 RepID=A0A5J5KWU5_9MICC|nr:sugar ABC transporter substrate-binding protein [Kocuria coralli]KAA9393952.1 sugar ABC transporter substrate-binding protein [Kocuria coralli]
MTRKTFTRARRSRLLSATAVLAVGALALSGCGQREGDSEASSTIDYWLWDTQQLPAYQQCADLFEQQHPEYNVNITQTGWDDYWQRLTAGFLAGTGPDVFINHPSRYPQYADLEVLLPLDEQDATANQQASDYQDGLMELWTGSDGHRYGSPKDWDSIALFYNSDYLADGGVSPEELGSLEWNPEDGGSFEAAIAHLTVDDNGVRGDEPGFDKDNVAVYGLGLSDPGGGNTGQGQWGSFANGAGWEVTDEPFWGTEYNYDDPALHETLDWYFGLSDKGYMPKYGQFNQDDGTLSQLMSGSVAVVSDGSWMVPAYSSSENFEVGTARMPTGPDGTAPSTMSGVADSISADADNPEAAAEFVAFMGSQECQSVVAEAGVVFPARTDSVERTEEIWTEQGFDTSAFTDPVEEGDAFFLPITSHGADVAALTIPAFQEIWADRPPSAEVLDRINPAINDLFIADKEAEDADSGN